WSAASNSPRPIASNTRRGPAHLPPVPPARFPNGTRTVASRRSRRCSGINRCNLGPPALGSIFLSCLPDPAATLVRLLAVHHFFNQSTCSEAKILLVLNRWCESSRLIQTH